MHFTRPLSMRRQIGEGSSPGVPETAPETAVGTAGGGGGVPPSSWFLMSSSCTTPKTKMKIKVTALLSNMCHSMLRSQTDKATSEQRSHFDVCLAALVLGHSRQRVTIL